MGVDTKLILPGNVRVKDVAKVIAKLLGKSSTLNDRGGVEVSDIILRETGIPQLVEISIVDEGCYNYFFEYTARERTYFFDCRAAQYLALDSSCRGLVARCCPKNIWLFHAVADFFGGIVDDCDSDDSYNDHQVAFETDTMNCPSDGEPWLNFQKRIHELKPIGCAP